MLYRARLAMPLIENTICFRVSSVFVEIKSHVVEKCKRNAFSTVNTFVERTGAPDDFPNTSETFAGVSKTRDFHSNE